MIYLHSRVGDKVRFSQSKGFKGFRVPQKVCYSIKNYVLLKTSDQTTLYRRQQFSRGFLDIIRITIRCLKAENEWEIPKEEWIANEVEIEGPNAPK